MDELTIQKWYALCDKLDGQGYAKGYGNLTPAEQVWVDIRSLIDSTENGGLISYFYNHGADRLHECFFALDLLGADVIRAQLQRIGALFPGGVPKTIDGRNEIINSWDDEDESTHNLMEDVDTVMFAEIGHLEERLAQFLSENGLLADP